MSKKEREICKFDMDLNIYIYFLFVCALANLGNGNNISAYGPGLKTGMDFRGVV